MTLGARLLAAVLVVFGAFVAMTPAGAATDPLRPGGEFGTLINGERYRAAVVVICSSASATTGKPKAGQTVSVVHRRPDVSDEVGSQGKVIVRLKKTSYTFTSYGTKALKGPLPCSGKGQALVSSPRKGTRDYITVFFVRHAS